MGYYKIRSHAGTGYYLNVAIDGPIISSKNVILWSEACPLDQIWSIATLGSNQQVKTINNLSYMLNANTSTWNCNVYTANEDTSVNFEEVTPNTKIYYIRLKSHPEKYLTADGKAENSNVSWANQSTTTAGKNAQQWKLSTATLPSIYTRVAAGHDTLGDTQMTVNAKYIFDDLKGRGFTKNAICGILGNFECESTINPAAWGVLDDMYSAYGLAQWDDGKDFIVWAKEKNYITEATAEKVDLLAYSDPKKLMNAELAYLIDSWNDRWLIPDSSINQSKYGTTTTLTAAQFKVSTLNVGTLARVFCGHYERPKAPDMTKRVEAAEKWYGRL